MIGKATLGLFGAALACFGSAALSQSDDPGPKFGKLYVQLFNDLTLVKEGKLGMSRTTLVHETAFERASNDPVVKQMFELRQQAKASGWVVNELMDVSFRTKLHDGRGVGVIVAVGAEKGLLQDSIPRFIDKPLEDEILREALNSANGTMRARIDRYRIFAQRISFEHQECLNCHREYKLEDPAAVAIFAYYPVKAP